jgi:hypothetical protein
MHPEEGSTYQVPLHIIWNVPAKYEVTQDVYFSTEQTYLSAVICANWSWVQIGHLGFVTSILSSGLWRRVFLYKLTNVMHLFRTTISFTEAGRSTGLMPWQFPRKHGRSHLHITFHEKYFSSSKTWSRQNFCFLWPRPPPFPHLFHLLTVTASLFPCVPV